MSISERWQEIFIFDRRGLQVSGGGNLSDAFNGILHCTKILCRRMKTSTTLSNPWKIQIVRHLLLLIISANNTEEDPSLRIESSAIINLRRVSTKLNKYIVFTMQMYRGGFRGWGAQGYTPLLALVNRGARGGGVQKISITIVAVNAHYYKYSILKREIKRQLNTNQKHSNINK